MGLGCLSRISGAVMLQNHYPFMAVPFLWLATLAGLGQLHSWRSAWTGWAVALLCLCSVTLYIVEGAGPGGVHYEPSAYEMDAESTAARRCLSKVPASSALLAELSISALAADRKTLYTHMPPADVALDHAVLEVEPAGRFAALPGYLRYVASQRALAVTLAAERGMVELARCGPYMLLGNR